MKKRIVVIVTLVLTLALAACGTASVQPVDGPGMIREPDLTARIMEDGGDELLLAGLREPYSDVYTVSKSALTDAGAYLEELRPGEMLALDFDGSVEEAWPARLGSVTGAAVTEDGRDRLYQCYLDVMEDLWEKDPALHDGITQIGFDLASTRLAPSEQAAVALIFARDHGNLTPLLGARQELTDAGFIDGETLVWDDGVLLSIREKNDEDGEVLFDAELWRSGLGAYLFCDCRSKKLLGGDWEPCTVGSEAVA